MRRMVSWILAVGLASLLLAGCVIDPDVDLEPFDLLLPANNTTIDLSADTPVLVDFEPTEAPPFMRNHDITYHFVFGRVGTDLKTQGTIGTVAGGKNVTRGDAVVDYRELELTELLLKGMADDLGFEAGDTARILWTIRATLTSNMFEGVEYASTSRVLQFVLTAP